MTIKKYQGKTKEEAIENAKAELGPRVVIMNVKEVHPKGFLGSFKKPSYEVTAAVEDEFVPKEDETSVYIGRSMSTPLWEGPSRLPRERPIRKQPPRAEPGDSI